MELLSIGCLSERTTNINAYFRVKMRNDNINANKLFKVLSNNLLYRYPAVFRTHVSCWINLSVLKLHPDWKITATQMLVKWQSIEFNMDYIVERFYRVKFQNMRHCLYNKQTYFLLLTLFDNLKWSIVSACMLTTKISKINTCVKGHNYIDCHYRTF